MLSFDLHIIQVALLLQFVVACAGERHEEWSIASMTYKFVFPLSCDVSVVQTLVVNYTYGNYSSVCEGYFLLNWRNSHHQRTGFVVHSKS